MTEPKKRPYYDAEAAAAKRRVLCLPAGTAPQHIKTVAVGFGRNGIYLVQRPSDETMEAIKKVK